MSCTHDKFAGAVDVKRIADRGPGRFLTTVSIHCAQCGERFRFVGRGIVPPMVDADALELRVPIQPISAIVGPTDAAILTCRHKFIDSKACAKCGWVP